MATIIIPTALRSHTEKKDQLVFAGTTVGEVLQNLVSTYQEVSQYIFTADGDLCTFMNIFINGEDARFMQGMDTKIHDDDIIMLVPALCGG